VDALPKLDAELKPIYAFKKDRGWAALAQSILDFGNTDEDAERPKRDENARFLLAFLGALLLLVALFFTRVLL
jgi:hypothetical protein